jgi:hypothetical protein
VDCYSSNSNSSLRGKSTDTNTRKGKDKEMMVKIDEHQRRAHLMLASNNQKLGQEFTLDMYMVQATPSQ